MYQNQEYPRKLEEFYNIKSHKILVEVLTYVKGLTE